MITSAHNVALNGEIKEKAGESANMVTLYDVAIQDFLISEITKQYPDAFFIAEEKENSADALMRKYCFIIDPIDGTTNFIHEYRHSCISLALFSYGKPIFSAIYDPYQNEMFSAVKDGGAFLNGKRIQVSKRDMKHSLVAFGTAPYYKKQFGDVTFDLCRELFIKCCDVRRCGSAALDLAYLAAGRNDIFFEYLLSPWDIAAGALLITEAGGIITDANGKSIDFSAPCSVVAATPTVYDSMLDTVKNHR